MVYEIKCSVCDKVIDFGSGEEPDRIPSDAIEWEDGYYCSACVKEFVRLGSDNLTERIDYLEDRLKEVSKDLGIEFNPPDKN
jgi:hypothetical protein